MLWDWSSPPESLFFLKKEGNDDQADKIAVAGMSRFNISVRFFFGVLMNKDFIDRELNEFLLINLKNPFLSVKSVR